MKMMTYRTVAILMAAPFALLSVACSGSEDGLTAENITLDECVDLFPEEGDDAEEDMDEDSDGGEMLEGDYDADGDVDDDDEAIENRCEELMSDEESSDEEEE